MNLHPLALPLLAAAALPAMALAAAPSTPGLPMSGIPGGKAITCRAFLKLSGASATNVLYFINGYAAGIQDQVSAGTPNLGGAGNSTAPAKADDLSNLTGVTMDEVKTLCRAKPQASVLSTIPGGEPVTGNGTLTGSASDSAAAGSGTAGTAAGTATSPATSGGGNTGATFGASGSGTTSTTGAAAAPGAATGSSATSATPNTVTVPTPATGTVTTNPTTGLSTATPGGAGSAAGGAAAP
jgi:hypothetical protein